MHTSSVVKPWHGSWRQDVRAVCVGRTAGRCYFSLGSQAEVPDLRYVFHMSYVFANFRNLPMDAVVVFIWVWNGMDQYLLIPFLMG